MNAAPSEVRNDTARAEGLWLDGGSVNPGWLTSLVSCVGLAVGPSSVLVFCYGVFIPALHTEFHWGIGPISLGASVIAIMVVATSALGGFLVDRIGGRSLVLWSIPLFSAGLVSLAMLGPDIKHFYGSLVMVSALGFGLWPVSYMKVVTPWFDRHLGLSLGIANSGVGLGAAILPAVASMVSAAHGWRAAYVVLGLMALSAWPVCFFLLRERPAAPVDSSVKIAGAAHAPAGLSLRESVREKDFWLMVIGFMALGATNNSIIAHQPRILAENGIPAQQVLALQAGFGLSLIVSRLLTGWLLDRLRANLVMVCGCLAASVAVTLYALGSPFGTAPVSALVIGFVIGAEFDALGFMIPRYFGLGAFGAIYSIVFSAFQLCSALGVAFVGMRRQASGSYETPLLLIAALTLISAFAFLAMGRYRFARSEHP